MEHRISLPDRTETEVFGGVLRNAWASGRLVLKGKGFKYIMPKARAFSVFFTSPKSGGERGAFYLVVKIEPTDDLYAELVEKANHVRD